MHAFTHASESSTCAMVINSAHMHASSIRYKNGVFIASPQNITKELLAKVRTDVPGSRIVAYWDFGDIPIVGRSKVRVAKLSTCCAVNVVLVYMK